MARALVGLGSNIEPRRDYLKLALVELALPPLKLLAQSALYETEPMDVKNQAAFLNMAVLLETKLGAEDLLKALKAIEAKAHKKVLLRRGPRSLDLDLWYYESLCLDTEELTLPHPKIGERPFVLIPMADIAPDWKHPKNGKTAQEMLQALPKPWPSVTPAGAL